MKRVRGSSSARYLGIALVSVVALLVASCGSDTPAEDGGTLAATSGLSPASGTCLADDPDCADGADGGVAGPLPSAIALGDPDDPNAPLQISYGGFFYSNGEVSQLCSALAESFPPQCASPIIEIMAPLDVVLEYVAESFGNPEDAKINIDQGVYWTDDWVNLGGFLKDGNFVLE